MEKENECKKEPTTEEPAKKDEEHVDCCKNARNTTLKLSFAPNEFFTNEYLSVTIEYENEQPVKSVAEPINWKTGKNTTKKIESKKQKSKKTGKTRTIEKEVKCQSFFTMFENYNMEDLEDDAFDEEGPTGEDANIFTVADNMEQIMDIGQFSLEFYLDCRPEEPEEDDSQMKI